jgi:2-methylcitrate dehydratase PrpD
MIASYAQHYGGSGASRIIGVTGRVSAPMAALANGVFAHAFELDSLRKPGAGVHPGAALVPAALAIAEEIGASGNALLTAIVAGCEVMFRIGAASRHTSELLGFHAPGLTGPFVAAITAGHLLGLDAGRMCNALGIAGSFGGGVLAFAKADNGSMVKRLHLGRAAEAGILAARLAERGYEGPDTILDGEFGFLQTYCKESDAALLTQGLGIEFETRKLCFKRYPCHVTAHTPMQSILALRGTHGFDGHDVRQVIVRASAKVLSHHSNHDPADTMAAQYSVPFCVAVALLDDPMDPEAFLDRGLGDASLRALCRQVEMNVLDDDTSKRSTWASEVTIRLNDGREFIRAADDFEGTPTSPLSAQALRHKYLRCANLFEPATLPLQQLECIESLPDVRAMIL